MSEELSRSQLTESLNDLGVGVEELLERVASVNDGMGNRHRWISLNTDEGDSLQLAKTDAPNGGVSYSLLRVLKVDGLGFIESHQYTWNEEKAKHTYTKRSESEVYSSRLGVNSRYEVSYLDDECVEDMKSIITAFFEAGSRLFVENSAVN